MTGNLNYLNDVVNIEPIPVELLDGVFHVAKAQGNLDLSSDIKLSNVLYIPNFQCNLVSIAQLNRELKCFVIFTDELCVIQGRTSRNLIGVGELRGGVSCFNNSATVKV